MALAQAPGSFGEVFEPFVGRTASVLGVGAILTVTRAEFMTDKGSGGSIMTKEQIIKLNEKVGELTEKDATSHAGNAIRAALGTLTGTGSIKGSSGTYHLEIDRAAYEAAFLRAALPFNTAVAEAAKKK